MVTWTQHTSSLIRTHNLFLSPPPLMPQSSSHTNTSTNSLLVFFLPNSCDISFWALIFLRLSRNPLFSISWIISISLIIWFKGWNFGYQKKKIANLEVLLIAHLGFMWCYGLDWGFIWGFRESLLNVRGMYRNGGTFRSIVGSFSDWFSAWMVMEAKMGDQGKWQIDLLCIKDIGFIVAIFTLSVFDVSIEDFWFFFTVEFIHVEVLNLWCFLGCG